MLGSMKRIRTAYGTDQQALLVSLFSRVPDSRYHHPEPVQIPVRGGVSDTRLRIFVTGRFGAWCLSPCPHYYVGSQGAFPSSRDMAVHRLHYIKSTN